MLYFYTSHNTSNSRIIKIDLERPDPKNWIEVVPEHPKNVIHFANVINKYVNNLFCNHDNKNWTSVTGISL